MAIVRWTPARELLSMRDQMDRVFDDVFPTWRRLAWEGSSTVQMPIDVYQSEKEYVVKAVLPGVKSDDLDVSIVGETLTIKASTKASTKEEGKVDQEDWLLRETGSYSYARTISLPSEVQADKVDATLEDGILTLKLPKAEALLPRSIKVRSGK